MRRVFRIFFIVLVGATAVHADGEREPMEFLISTNPPGIRLTKEYAPGKKSYAFMTPETASRILERKVQNANDVKELSTARNAIDRYEQRGALRFVLSPEAAVTVNQQAQAEFWWWANTPATGRCQYSDLLHGKSQREIPMITLAGLLPPVSPDFVNAFYDRGCVKDINRFQSDGGVSEACWGAIDCRDGKPPRICFCDMVEPIVVSGDIGQPLTPSLGRCPTADECLRQCDAGRSHDGRAITTDAKPGTPDDARWESFVGVSDISYASPPIRIGSDAAGMCAGTVRLGPKQTVQMACLTHNAHCPSAKACVAQGCTYPHPSGAKPGTY